MSERPPKPSGRWSDLRPYTPARVGLGRTGVSLPTVRHLEFQLAHALARDAVYAQLDAGGIATALAELEFVTHHVRSAAPDRYIYLRRPDLGRRLAAASRELLEAARQQDCRLCFVLADGLSATAVNRYAVETVAATANALDAGERYGVPAVLAEQGRVALGDEIGELLGAEVVVVLIGERPGLSAHDSLGAYVTWTPQSGTTDAFRNCISNVRYGGLSTGEAGAQIAALIAEARRHRCTGVALSSVLAAHRLPHSRG